MERIIHCPLLNQYQHSLYLSCVVVYSVVLLYQLRAECPQAGQVYPSPQVHSRKVPCLPYHLADFTVTGELTVMRNTETIDS